MSEPISQEKVVVRLKSGGIEKGQGLGFDQKDRIYRVIPENAGGGAIEVPLRAIKAIFSVRSLDGDKDRKKRRGFVETANGQPVRVCFRDQEILYGRKQDGEDELGFWMRLDDADDNNTLAFIPKDAPAWVELVDAEAGDLAFLSASVESNHTAGESLLDEFKGPPTGDLESTPDSINGKLDDVAGIESADVAGALMASDQSDEQDGWASEMPSLSGPSAGSDGSLPSLSFDASSSSEDDSYSDLPPIMNANNGGATAGPATTVDGLPPLNFAAMPELPSTASEVAQPLFVAPELSPVQSIPPAGETGVHPAVSGQDPYSQAPPPGPGTGVYPPMNPPVTGQDPYSQAPPPGPGTGVYPSMNPPMSGQDPYSQAAPPGPGPGVYPSMNPPALGQDPYAQTAPLPPGTGVHPSMNPPMNPPVAQDPYSQAAPPSPLAGAGAHEAVNAPMPGQDPYSQAPPAPGTGVYPSMNPPMAQDPYSQAAPPPLPVGTGAYEAVNAPMLGQDPYSQVPPPPGTGAYEAVSAPVELGGIPPGLAVPAPAPLDSVFSSDAPIPSLDLGELLPGNPLGTGDLPDANAVTATPAPALEDEDDEDEEDSHDHTLISASTKDWASMMGGVAAGANIVVPRAISVADAVAFKAQGESSEEVEAASVEDNAADAMFELELPMEAPAEEPVVPDLALEPGTYSVENESLALPNVSFQGPGDDSPAQTEAPQLLPFDALTEISETPGPSAASPDLPTGEYSLEGNNVIAMPWLDGSGAGEASSGSSRSNGVGADLEDLFEDPVEMKPEEDEDKLDDDLASFLDDL